MTGYLFKSKRLGFRNWQAADIAKMAAINTDSEVMMFFPSTQSTEGTMKFISRMKKQYTEKGYCYFAVDRLEDHEFIGFIGLSEPIYEADFTPCVDIGWRLARKFWSMGYATEGAKKCLAYGFEKLSLKKVVSTAPVINKPSIQVMQKIGMNKVKYFDHPLLPDNKRLRACVLYEINRTY